MSESCEHYGVLKQGNKYFVEKYIWLLRNGRVVGHRTIEVRPISIAKYNEFMNAYDGDKVFKEGV